MSHTCVSLCLFISPSICLYDFMSFFYLPAAMSSSVSFICLLKYISVCLLIFKSVCMSTYLSVSLYLLLCAGPSVWLSVYLSVYISLSVYLHSVYQSIMTHVKKNLNLYLIVQFI